MAGSEKLTCDEYFKKMILPVVQLAKYGRFVWVLLFFLHITNAGAQEQTWAQDSIIQIKIDSLELIINTSKSVPIKIIAYRNLSTIYQKTDLQKSSGIIAEAIQLAEDEKADTLVPDLWNDMGNILYYQGIYNESLVYFNKYYQHYSKLGREDKLVLIYPNMGAVYQKMKQLDQALELYLKAFNYINVTTDPQLVKSRPQINLTLTNNIGSIYNEQKKRELSIKYYLSGLQVAEELNSYEFISRICHNLGKLYLEENILDSAFLYINRSLSNRKQWGNLNGLAITQGLLAEYYISNRNFIDAKKVLDEAYINAEKVNSAEAKLQILNAYVKVYEKTGDYKAAFDVITEVNKFKDSIFNADMEMEIYKIQFQNEYDKKEIENKLIQQKIETRYLVLSFTLAALLAFAAFIYYFQRNKYRNLKLENDLLALRKTALENDIESKNKELTTNVMYLIQRNELLTDIIKRLAEAKHSANDENRIAIQRIITDLGTLISGNAWEEFEVRFQQVHTQFYTRLQNLHPQLTPNEIKLCAFLRLNMTTKDISALTNQNAKSVEMARHRLRKKLNITNTHVNLVNYLMDI